MFGKPRLINGHEIAERDGFRVKKYDIVGMNGVLDAINFAEEFKEVIPNVKLIIARVETDHCTLRPSYYYDLYQELRGLAFEKEKEYVESITISGNDENTEIIVTILLEKKQMVMQKRHLKP